MKQTYRKKFVPSNTNTHKSPPQGSSAYYWGWITQCFAHGHPGFPGTDLFIFFFIFFQLLVLQQLLLQHQYYDDCYYHNNNCYYYC